MANGILSIVTPISHPPTSAPGGRVPPDQGAIDVRCAADSARKEICRRSDLARRPSGSATNQIRACDQPQDRQNTWSEDSSNADPPCRRSDRVSSSSSSTPCMSWRTACTAWKFRCSLGRREPSYRLALATKLEGTALARLWPRFAQCSRNMPSMARSSAGLISRECATVTE